MMKSLMALQHGRDNHYDTFILHTFPSHAIVTHIQVIRRHWQISKTFKVAH